MPRPVKWARDVHPIRDRAMRSKTETWSRQDIEALFGISRPSAQSLMKAIGEVQTVGAAHFVDRASLLTFLDEMIAAESVEEGLRQSLERAAPVARSRTLSIPLPPDLRNVTMADLPSGILLSPGHIEIDADTAEGLCEQLMLLGTIMQNDLERWSQAVQVLQTAPPVDAELRRWLGGLREDSN